MPPIFSLNHAAMSCAEAEKGSPRSFRIDDGADTVSRGPRAARCARCKNWVCYTDARSRACEDRQSHSAP